MATRVIIGIAVLLCVAACGALSATASSEMVERVNEKLRGTERFEQLGWYWPKIFRLHREYDRLCPSGRLLLKVRVLIGLGVTGMLICARSLGFFGE